MTGMIVIYSVLHHVLMNFDMIRTYNRTSGDLWMTRPCQIWCCGGSPILYELYRFLGGYRRLPYPAKAFSYSLPRTADVRITAGTRRSISKRPLMSELARGNPKLLPSLSHRLLLFGSTFTGVIRIQWVLS
jgi:hypothetical protein